MRPTHTNTPSEIDSLALENGSAPSRRVLPGRSVLRDLVLLTLLAAPLFFYGLGSWPFRDPDEGRYAEISREMIVSGDFISPTLNFVSYFEKPPLLYWLVSGSFRLFGFTEGAGRLVPALAATAGLLVAYALGRRMFGRRAGLLSGTILATSLMWTVMAHALVIDMLVSILILSALALWWSAHTAPDGEDAPASRARFLAFWGLLALSILAKGPISVVLVGGTIFVYALVTRQMRALTRMSWVRGLALAAAIAAPWFVLVSLKNPGFATFFWYDQHVKRFLGMGTGGEHARGPAYFLLYLPLLVLPWTAFVPAAVGYTRKHFRGTWTEPRRGVVYLMAGSVVTVAFFSLASGKLLTYVLPAVPLLAILLAGYLDRVWTVPLTQLGWPLWTGLVALVVLIGTGGVALCAAGLGHLLSLPPGLEAGRAIVLGIVLLLWAAGVLAAGVSRRVSALTGALVAGFAVSSVALIPILGALSPGLFVKPLLDTLRPGLDAGSDIFTYDSYMPSASFYTKRRIPILGSPGELAFGMSQLSPEDRALWFRPTAEALNVATKPRAAYFLVQDTKDVEQLIAASGGSLRVIAENQRCIVVGNTLAAALVPSHAGSRPTASPEEPSMDPNDP